MKKSLKKKNLRSKNKKPSAKSVSIVKSKSTKSKVVYSPVLADVLPDKPKKRRKKGTGGIMYFTQDTEDAIVLFNKTEDLDKREEIYNTKIKYPFEKLVENVFNTFKFSYFDVSPLDVQKETLSHLVANITKFDQSKGKAYSYFSIVAKHYLIYHNNNNYKRFNQHVDISEENEDNTVRLQTSDNRQKKAENKEFITMMINYWDNNIQKIFTKPRDLNIARAVVELFRNSDMIDAFNKKALYLYIREISNCRTQQITKIISKMKQYQEAITKSYVENGTFT